LVDNLFVSNWCVNYSTVFSVGKVGYSFISRVWLNSFSVVNV
jgi:hypothetical protein